MELSNRQKQILGELIKEYVKRAEPVSSNFLVEKCGFDCSPATIRAEMLNLEQEGFLAQPHTSAGRVPTDKAYRYFVDHLLKDKESNLPEKDRKAIDKTIENAPKNPHAMSSGLAKTMANLTNDLVISGIRDTDEFYRMGFANIFELPESDEVENIFGSGSIFDQFENYFGQLFQQWPALNRRGEPDRDVVVYIGRENLAVGDPERDTVNEAVIITHYPLPKGYEGISAVIGPMRMAYDRNMAMLRYVAKKMGELE
ncbi:MAG: hypothetical protein Q7S32_00160 [bacterium]|nr:hypothetical protein [bacterium]